MGHRFTRLKAQLKTQLKAQLKAQPKLRVKPLLRWAIVGLTAAFLLAALREHWAEVTELRLRESGLGYAAAGFGITLVAHVWSGWVWGWILGDLDRPVATAWAIGTFLQTNIAKYLPGNVWHFISRVRAAQQHGIPTAIAALSVAIEALCMAAAAAGLAIAVVPNLGAIAAGLLAIAVGLHPRVLNPIVARLGASKAKQFARLDGDVTADPTIAAPTATASDSPDAAATVLGLRRYPWRSFLGELGFVMLRGLGFLGIWLALAPIAIGELPRLLGGFGLAWLLGLVVPGAPGGVGVFEATALSVLGGAFPAGTIFGAIALYRLVSVSTEAIGAGIASSLAASWQR
ncbi:MAG: UPF0104 family protein [Geitlerinemataceae cyanobacterium]